MKLIEDLPTPAWVGLAVASIRVLLDWRGGVSIWANIRRVIILYVVSSAVSWLAFFVMVQPGVAMTGRDIAICTVITFFGINIVYSLKKLGEDLEKNPLQVISTLVAIWLKPSHLPPVEEENEQEEHASGPTHHMTKKPRGKKR